MMMKKIWSVPIVALGISAGCAGQEGQYSGRDGAVRFGGSYVGKKSQVHNGQYGPFGHKRPLDRASTFRGLTGASEGRKGIVQIFKKTSSYDPFYHPRGGDGLTCTGVPVGRRLVLTAASCFNEGFGEASSKSQFDTLVKSYIVKSFPFGFSEVIKDIRYSSIGWVHSKKPDGSVPPDMQRREGNANAWYSKNGLILLQVTLPFSPEEVWEIADAAYLHKYMESYKPARSQEMTMCPMQDIKAQGIQNSFQFSNANRSLIFIEDELNYLYNPYGNAPKNQWLTQELQVPRVDFKFDSSVDVETNEGLAEYTIPEHISVSARYYDKVQRHVSQDGIVSKEPPFRWELSKSDLGGGFFIGEGCEGYGTEASHGKECKLAGIATQFNFISMQHTDLQECLGSGLDDSLFAECRRRRDLFINATSCRSDTSPQESMMTYRMMAVENLEWIKAKIKELDDKPF